MDGGATGTRNTFWRPAGVETAVAAGATVVATEAETTAGTAARTAAAATAAAETEPARADVLTATCAEKEENRRTRHSSRRTKPTRCSGTPEQKGNKKVSCLSWRS